MLRLFIFNVIIEKILPYCFFAWPLCLGFLFSAFFCVISRRIQHSVLICLLDFSFVISDCISDYSTQSQLFSLLQNVLSFQYRNVQTYRPLPSSFILYFCQYILCIYTENPDNIKTFTLESQDILKNLKGKTSYCYFPKYLPFLLISSFIPEVPRFLSAIYSLFA